ncbi:MAG: hypothetical protein KC413_24605 [Anaerolineales bacterium]|nr:hypothetical protein [Anaerolineales bacterium]
MSNDAKNKDRVVREQLWLLATAIRDSYFSAAVSAYEDASIDGLCHDGAWECALEAMRAIDFDSVIAKLITAR